MEKILIPIPEFTVWASVSRTQIYREIHAGRLRLTKRGRRSFIARADAEAWLDALRNQSDDPCRPTPNKGGRHAAE